MAAAVNNKDKCIEQLEFEIFDQRYRQNEDRFIIICSKFAALKVKFSKIDPVSSISIATKQKEKIDALELKIKRLSQEGLEAMSALYKELQEQMEKYNSANKPEFSTALSFHATNLKFLIYIYKRTIGQTLSELSNLRSNFTNPA